MNVRNIGGNVISMDLSAPKIDPVIRIAPEVRQQLARRKQIYEALYPQVKHGGDRKSEDVKSTPQHEDLIPRFTASASAKTGQSEQTI